MLKFNGKVAVITGAGRGLGRAHAKFLASRGAAVVVNDMGGAPIGGGVSNGPADEVVSEILAAGGQAVTNYADVAQEPQSIIDTAIERFGRLDIVVNNAGIDRRVPFSDPDVMDAIKQHIEVHLYGTAGVTSAAWEHLIASGTGRIVNTISPTLFGFPNETPYVSAKGALFGFTRTLSLEAASHGITVNGIAPTAATRLIDIADISEEYKQEIRSTLPPSLVSPLVAYLAHEECAVNGQTFLVAGGEVKLMTLGQTEGFHDSELSPESVQVNLSTIMDTVTNQVPPIQDIGS